MYLNSFFKGILFTMHVVCIDGHILLLWTSVLEQLLAVGQNTAMNLGGHTPVCKPAFSF